MLLTLDKELQQYPQDISDENNRILIDLKRGLNDPCRLQEFLRRVDEDHVLEWHYFEAVQGRTKLKQRIKQFRKPFDALYFETLGTALIQDWIGIALEAQGSPKGKSTVLKFPAFVYLYVRQGKITHTLFTYDYDTLAAQIGSDEARLSAKLSDSLPGMLRQLPDTHADQLPVRLVESRGAQLASPLQSIEAEAAGTREVLSRFLHMFGMIVKRYPYQLPDLPPDYMTKEGVQQHVTDLISQATHWSETKQRPNNYPHEDVVVHVAQLQEEELGQNKGTQLSDRLVTMQEGAEITGVPYGTVGRWLSVGRLEERGRLWLTHQGGRSVPLYSLADLSNLAEHRPPVGKHIKKTNPPRRRAKATP